MCEWFDFYYTEMCECYTLANVRLVSFHNTGMCEYLFGQCAKGTVIMCECGDVRVEMCEWSSHNVRVVWS